MPKSAMHTQEALSNSVVRREDHEEVILCSNNSINVVWRTAGLAYFFCADNDT